MINIELIYLLIILILLVRCLPRHLFGGARHEESNSRYTRFSISSLTRECVFRQPADHGSVHLVFYNLNRRPKFRP